MNEYTGWLLDLYEDGERGLALWFVLEDESRICVRQHFPVKFFAAGPPARLRTLWRWLREQNPRLRLGREVRRDLFVAEPLAVLAAELDTAAALAQLFPLVEQAFPDLSYYDVDVQIQTRHAAVYGTFPLAQCRISVDGQQRLQALEVLDSAWDRDPERPPLRVLELNLRDDPRHAPPATLELRCGAWHQTLPFVDGSAPAYWVKSALRKFDPDILLTDYGDTWLLEELLRRAGGEDQLLFSRDPLHRLQRLESKTYFSYGQVVYRGQQIHLYGRTHIDRRNAMLWGDYSLEGIFENARVSALPIQTAARVSPGTGISSMQMLTAMRTGVLVPWRKQQVEQPRPMIDLIHSDFGGMVYQPVVGLHRNVGAIDFTSLYPAVMVRCNISPEKTAITLSDPPAPSPGLIPQTLAPLLSKRVALKRRINELPAWDPRRKWYKERTAAHKWLLVVCFGYLGYKNARFGLIGSHEAVTAGGREALLRAKETAEDAGFEILHLFVDGLWLQRPDCSRPADFEPILDEITQRTGLPIALDGVFRWIVFLPSRVDERVPVGNRYFGVYTDGSLKVRGLEVRRRDSAPWVAQTQLALLECLAQAPDAADLPRYLPQALRLLRGELRRLRAGNIPLEDLLVGQKLSRVLEKYTSPSPAALAARQLLAAGKPAPAGQRIRFLYVRGPQRVWAWDQPQPPDPRWVDVTMYKKLLLRAAENILQPLGISRAELALRMEGDLIAVPLWRAPAARPRTVPRGLPAAARPPAVSCVWPART
jgi:DNA polymerase-2